MAEELKEMSEEDLVHALGVANDRADNLRQDAQALQEHRDELYRTLDSYSDEINELREDLTELTTTSVEVLEAMEEADRDAEVYRRMVNFYMRTLHAIASYEGDDVEVPAGIALAAISSNLIPVQRDPETGDISNVED